MHHNEMCCAGVKQYAGNTAYSSCCGTASYDRRNSSCPCNDGVVAFNIPADVAYCCYSNDRTFMGPYNTLTEGCCNGVGYNEATEFCCGDLIGNSATQMCCSETIIDIQSVDVGHQCCVLADGGFAVYEPTTQLCCGGNVQDFPSTDFFCCDNEVFSKSLGDACCNGQPYNTSGSVCCAGIIAIGNGCCNGVPYFTDNTVCCNGAISAGDSCCNGVGYFANQFTCCNNVLEERNLTISSCCVDQAFDSYIETCCGSRVYANPQIQINQTHFETSHHTRCCGDWSDDVTLVPYDYNTQTCCNGVIVDFGVLTANTAECCGTQLMNPETQMCCGGVPVDISSASEACCSGQVIDPSNAICCSGIVSDKPAIDAVCCGTIGIDPSNEICCNNGVPASLGGNLPNQTICCNGVVQPKPTETYICCGDIAMDSTSQVCCGEIPQSVNDVAIEQALCCNGELQTFNGTDFICCGVTAMDPTLEICCSDQPRSLNGIEPAEAICCGDGCIDASLYWCCEGRQYQKGRPGVNVSGRTCNI
uniref:galaxin n=1 Tax=Ciona intestinalis TaxID=7719 RepID=UPI0002B8EC89|nr:galaxin [Ciona intestinalis]|eukprot:XP_002125824.2 galaxin [Ciona intestinalis]